MARAVLRDIVFGLATTGLLIGCVEGGGKTGDAGGSGMVAAPGKKSGTKDIEAPEVFQATDSAPSPSFRFSTPAPAPEMFQYLVSMMCKSWRW